MRVGNLDTGTSTSIERSHGGSTMLQAIVYDLYHQLFETLQKHLINTSQGGQHYWITGQYRRIKQRFPIS